MARHLHLHVGLGKCGSTTLQAYLAAYRGDLLAQAVDYPDLGSGDAGNMTPYALSQRPADVRWGSAQFDFDSAMSRLRRALRQPAADTVLLSSEALTHPRYLLDLSWVSDAFDRVTVHLVLRARAAWLVSIYGQMVRAEGLHGSLANYLETPLVQNGARFAAFVDHWQCNADDVCLHLLRPDGRPLIPMLLEAVQPGLRVPPTDGMRRNASPSAFVLAALSHANAPEHRTLGHALGTIMRTAQRHDPDPGRHLLTRELAQRIDTRFADDTDALLRLRPDLRRADIETAWNTDLSGGTTWDTLRALAAFSAFCQDLRLPTPS